MDVRRCLIVTAPNQALAQEVCVGLAGAKGAGMFLAGLSPTGALPATHFISDGMISEGMAALLGSADLLFAACQQAALPYTLLQCQNLLAQSDVSQDNPFVAMTRLGIQLIQQQV